MNNYILADDLSGALEAGAAFRARGWRVTLPLDAAGVEQQSGAGELQVVSTETRGDSPERAATAVRETIAARKAVGSRLLFKKIDSTLRGPIGAELAALIEELAPPLVVVCPANPAAGRVVREGVLFVDGVSLSETDFRNDPQWPATTSRVGEVLKAQGLSSIGQLSLESLRGGRVAAAISASIAAGQRVLIADAETGNDLRMIAASTREAAPDSVLVGSGALAAALAETLPDAGRCLPDAGWEERRSVLIICGSAHPRSIEQLRYLSEHHNVSIVPFIAGETNGSDAALQVAALLTGRGVAAVRFSSPGRASAESSRELQQLIGNWTRSLLTRVSPDVIVLTGGETARIVCREIKGTQLEVIHEFEPGVVVSRLHRSGVGTQFVVTKPGGFGSQQALSGILPCPFEL